MSHQGMIAYNNTQGMWLLYNECISKHQEFTFLIEYISITPAETFLLLNIQINTNFESIYPLHCLLTFSKNTFFITIYNIRSRPCTRWQTEAAASNTLPLATTYMLWRKILVPYSRIKYFRYIDKKSNLNILPFLWCWKVSAMVDSSYCCSYCHFISFSCVWSDVRYCGSKTKIHSNNVHKTIQTAYSCPLAVFHHLNSWDEACIQSKMNNYTSSCHIIFNSIYWWRFQYNI